MKPFSLALVAGLLGGPALAAPYLPKQDSEVLERLPARRGDPAMGELRQLRAAAAARPDDPAAAASLARRYFELAMAEGDPRYVGYAVAALEPWRAAGDAPAELFFVRGLLRQYRHDFQGALRDLQEALQRDPEHVGARSWRAAILMVGAQYAAAREECRALESVASELLATGCRAYVDAITGSSRGAYHELNQALERRPDAAREIRLWALTRLAEMAWRLNEPAVAERHFREALALGVNDNFLLAAYADFLLEQARPKEVMALLRNWTRSDTLLLRLALAEKLLGVPDVKKHVQALAERFAASALRGERLHLAEEARFHLELKDDPKAALAAAAENWKSQREPRDAAVLLEAALAAHDRQAAEPALRWLDETGFENARLRRLAAQLK
jgi:Tfp pilus assembly protein PilF